MKVQILRVDRDKETERITTVYARVWDGWWCRDMQEWTNDPKDYVATREKPVIETHGTLPQSFNLMEHAVMLEGLLMTLEQPWLVNEHGQWQVAD